MVFIRGVHFNIDGFCWEDFEKFCKELGFETDDVLRAFVMKVRQDHVLPFDPAMVHKREPFSGPPPFVIDQWRLEEIEKAEEEERLKNDPSHLADVELKKKK